MEQRLPTPHPTAESFGGHPVSSQEQVNASIEKVSPSEAQEREQTPLAAPPLQAITANPQTVISGTGVSVSAKPSAIKVSGPVVAQNKALIEKQWVDKAKEIIKETKNDPYSQKRDLAGLQADYLKKRFNKNIQGELE